MGQTENLLISAAELEGTEKSDVMLLTQEFRGDRPSPPVREGEEMTVKIESLGREGDGIARVGGLVIFVPGTKVGDEARIKIVRVGRKVAFGETLE